MGRVAPKRTTKASTKSRRGPARARSISVTDLEWEQVQRFSARRGFTSISDGARQLLRSGLQTEELVDEYASAAAWQLAQAWADAQAIADGDRAVGSWDRIAKAGERARVRIRERAQVRRAVRTGT